jgi:hypothetical protein
LRENLKMKITVTITLLLLTLSVTAQDPCEFSSNVKDSIGEYKSTANYLMYERNFTGNAYIYFSLALTDGLPTLNVQFINKSKDFIKANCLDKNSRMYLQLENGKIVTLIHIDAEDCGTGVRNEEMNNRVMTGYFLFPKEAFEALKNSPVSMMRIRYSTETVDYILKDELRSELDAKQYKPSKYFINTLHCLED